MARRHQLTLFDCGHKRRSDSGYLEEESDGLEQVPPKRRFEAYPDSSTPGSSQVLSNDHQINYITLENPSGSTTIVVSTSSSAPAPVSSQTIAPGDSSQSTVSAPSKLPDDIALSPQFPPVQPVNLKFPITLFSGKPRSFNPAWYRSYSWLEYSVKQDACFCYPCRLFSFGGCCSSSRPELAFTSTGFKDWKHAMGKGGILTGHNDCRAHKEAATAWNQYIINLQKGTGISERLDSARAERIKQNRHYLKSVIEILLLCSQQEIALRGHRESELSANRGNFLEILKLVAAHDQIVYHRLNDGPKNAAYTSPEIQNTLLNVMGNIVRNEICLAVKNAGVYSILADETKDCSKRKQLAIVLRYVDIESATIFERFLTYVEATSLNAESLSKYILDTLKEHGLDPQNIISQGYDGASVMSGCCSGVQQRIKEIAPEAVYVHCYAHCLNLVLVDCTKSVSDASEFFSLLETLYVFMSTSKVHTLYLQQQSELYPTKQVRQLQRLSDTRWACRYLAVDAVCSTFGSILATLQAVVDGQDRAKAVEARGILLQVRTFKFLLLLIIFLRLLSCTKSLSDQLQSVNIDMAKAADLVIATITTVQEFRSDSAWNHMFKYVEDVAALPDINVTPQRVQRPRQLPRRLESGIVLESIGSRETVATSEQFRISLYFPILDAMISELQRRFSDKNLKIMKAVQGCSPNSPHFLQPKTLLPLAESHGLDMSLLSIECSLAKNTLKAKDLDSINEVLLEISSLKEAFPTLLKLLQIALTIAVSTAKCERSFSALKRIKSYLRSTMSEQRLVDLAVLSIERDLSQQLSLDEVVNQFAGRDGNRRIMLS